jgi:hypothetical protein
MAAIFNPTERADTDQQIPDKSLSVSTSTSFPSDALPTVLADYIAQSAEAIGCNSSYIALPLLASLGRAIGNKRVIKVKDDYTEPAIIWGAVIADSGQFKSPAFNSGTKFLVNQQKLDKDTHLITKDATLAAARDRLSGQPDSSLLVMPGELIDVLRGLGSRSQWAATKGKWIDAWHAESLIVHRGVGKSKVSVHIPHFSISIIGTTQPAVFKKVVVEERHMEDGMCDRFLLVWGSETKPAKWTTKQVDKVTQDKMQAVFHRLFNLDTRDIEPEEFFIEPVEIPMSPSAEQAWQRFFDPHHHAAFRLDRDLSAAYMKLSAYVPRIALILQLVQDAGEAPKPIGTEVISVTAMNRAIRLVQWFKAQTRHCYKLLAESPKDSTRRELVDLIRRNGEKITVRQLCRRTRQYHTSKQAEIALNDLVEAGYARRKSQTTRKRGGQSSGVYHLIPQANDR